VSGRDVDDHLPPPVGSAACGHNVRVEVDLSLHLDLGLILPIGDPQSDQGGSSGTAQPQRAGTAAIPAPSRGRAEASRAAEDLAAALEGPLDGLAEVHGGWVGVEDVVSSPADSDGEVVAGFEDAGGEGGVGSDGDADELKVEAGPARGGGPGLVEVGDRLDGGRTPVFDSEVEADVRGGQRPVVGGADPGGDVGRVAGVEVFG